MTTRALIVTGFGINCERETRTAFQMAGAQADLIHLNDLIADPGMLDGFAVFAVPGGFSFGDDVASGRIFANRLRYRLGAQLLEFIDRGNLVIGICNGFQVLVKMGLLPMTQGRLVQEVTLTHNGSNRFENRWVRLITEPGTHCIWTAGIDQVELPVRHGEGRFVPRDAGFLAQLERAGQIVLRYAGKDGQPAGGRYPENPNGSGGDVAGICDPTGRVFGLMPHPEAFLDPTNHPRWTREPVAAGGGLRFFQNAVRYVESNAAKTPLAARA